MWCIDSMAHTVLLERTKEKKMNHKRSRDLTISTMAKSHKVSRDSGVETIGKSEGLNVPFEVISLSKMSALERRELQMRLRSDLEQIQALQKRINSTAATSSSYARGTQMKRAQPVAKVSNSDTLLLKQCEQVLKRLMSHQYSWVFSKPVDVVELNIPDYFSVIKKPMDLGSIKTKIDSGSYSSPWGFVDDVRLTFTNAMTYNPPGNDVHIMADVMSKFFEARWKLIEKKLAAKALPQLVPAPTPQSLVQLKKRKSPPANCSVDMAKRSKLKMSVEEKQILSRHLESLVADLPEHIMDFLRRHGENANESGEDEIEIDIDSLRDETLFELQRLLVDYLGEKERGQVAKAEHNEIEILNESGLSNSSIHPCRGNEPADEDVDIGDNDPPISSYPPVVIEKDTTLKSSKCSSSSSSSSDSGSSSSDSDSGSSSGSDSNGCRVPTPTKAAKGNFGREAAIVQERSDVMNQEEYDAHSRPASDETDDRQEGENAPFERQVSPEKLYRAAVMIGRFADTILKAREKTLCQSQKADPEKLQRERKELEKQRREEKARLQAEAKAAEEAQAEEAKRRRELEREAARQALLKIKRTVEINESARILEELEMLRRVPVDLVPSSVDESSPDLLMDGIEGFKLGGVNPLEQLGLYIKADDEEEEEDTEPSSLPPAIDVEEGEV